jgi:rhodanese-related sulfurtransferase
MMERERPGTPTFWNKPLNAVNLDIVLSSYPRLMLYPSLSMTPSNVFRAWIQPNAVLLVATAAFVFLSSSGNAQTAPTSALAPEVLNIPKEVSVDEAETLMKTEKGLVIVDIRTSEEFDELHIPGAVNINFHSENFLTELEKLGLDRPILFHCASGGRSTQAVVKLYSSKFTKLYHLRAGIGGWQKAGKPLVEGKLPGSLQKAKEESEKLRLRREVETKPHP